MAVFDSCHRENIYFCVPLNVPPPSFPSPGSLPSFLGLLSKVIQKLHKEHISTLSTSSQDTQTISELLQWSLDLCRSCVHAMLTDVRKAFMNVLTSLIEKSSDPKLLKMLTKIVDEWVRGKVSGCGCHASSFCSWWCNQPYAGVVYEVCVGYVYEVCVV